MFLISEAPLHTAAVLVSRKVVPLQVLPDEKTVVFQASNPAAYRGTSLLRNSTPPWGYHRALGTVLLQGPRMLQFLMSEVPL